MILYIKYLAVFDDTNSFFDGKQGKIWKSNALTIRKMNKPSDLILLIFHQRFIDDSVYATHVCVGELIEIEHTYDTTVKVQQRSRTKVYFWWRNESVLEIQSIYTIIYILSDLAGR